MLPSFLYNTKALAVDLETTGLNWTKGDQPFAVSFTTYEEKDHYVRWPVCHKSRKVSYEMGELQEIVDLLSTVPTVVFHNAPFDYPMGKAYLNWGFGFDGIRDTLILAHCGNSSRPSYRLKPLCKELFGIEDDDQKDLQTATKEARKRGKKEGWALAEDVEADYWMAPPELCEKYAIRDTQRTMRLFKAFEPLLEATEPPYDTYANLVALEHRVLEYTVKMNLKGVRIDPAKIKELRAYYGGLVLAGEEKLKALGYGDLNPDSPKQKMEAFKALGFEPEERRRKKKDGSTTKTMSFDKKVLEKIAPNNPLAETLLEAGEAGHQLNSFIDPFEEIAVSGKDGLIIYPNFNSVGPKTGRWSGSRPNLQNVTSESSPLRKSSVEFKVRSCFIPREGYVWMLGDYSQIEVWRAAYASGDQTMLSILEAGKSLHDLTCDRVFGSKPDFAVNRPKYRKLAKIITFSIFYGSAPRALAQLLNVSLEEAKIYYETFWETYPGLRAYSQKLERLVRKQGWIRDHFGRTYFLPHNGAYKALNYVIQGSAGGVLKRAFVNVSKLLEDKYPESSVILSIHDEIVLEIKKEHLSQQLVSDVLKEMKGNFHEVLGMKKPFEVEICFAPKNWMEKIKYEVPV